ncbi:hypothetical protein GEMRC1_008082 [Eukaryota sp. GEM-RC1]
MSTTIWKQASTDDGRVYFYNPSTRETTWSLPCDWKEVHDQHGRSYFYNVKSLKSTWTPPPSYVAALPPVTVSTHSTNSPSSTIKVDPVVRPARPLELSAVEAILATHKKSSEYENPSEGTKAFNKMLSDHGVGSTWSLRQVMRACARDERWSAVDRFTIKKQLVTKYQKQRTVEEEQHQYDIERHECQSFRDILDRLTQQGVLNQEFMTNFYTRTRAKDLAEQIIYNIFSVVDKTQFSHVPHTRLVQVVYDHCEKVLRLSRKDDYRNRKEKEDKMLSALKNNSAVRHNYSWKHCSDIVIRMAKQFKLSTESMINVWKRLVDDFVRAEINQRQRQFQAEIMESRRIRQQFRLFLDQCAKKGLIHLGMKFEDLCKHADVFNAKPFYEMSKAVYGSPAVDLFRDYLSRCEERAGLNTTRLHRLGVIESSWLTQGCGNFIAFKDNIKQSKSHFVSSLQPHEITFVFEYINRVALSEGQTEIVGESVKSYMLEEGEIDDEEPDAKKMRVVE